MIRARQLAVSRPMYAFLPETWRSTAYGVGFEVDAVWFKRKNGGLAAVIGVYHPMVLGRDSQPTESTYEAWIAAADDNRYGGRWKAKWDGVGLSCYQQPVTPEEARQRTAFLDAMLQGFPDPPAGWDGWWTFEGGKR